MEFLIESETPESDILFEKEELLTDIVHNTSNVESREEKDSDDSEFTKYDKDVSDFHHSILMINLLLYLI